MAAWIERIPKEKWCRSYDEDGRRYGHMTTNLSESINKVFRGARNMPITSLVKCTYSRLVRYWVKRGTKAQQDAMSGKYLTSVIGEAMAKNGERATSMRVREFDVARTTFEVDDEDDTYSVNLTQWKCQCGKFQAFKFLCSHVIAACSVVAYNTALYVDPVFSIYNIINVYSSPFQPIGSEEGIPSSSEPKIIPDETKLRGTGRPKSTRIRNEMDEEEVQPSSSRIRCRICKQIGHNRHSCPTTRTTN